MAESDPPNPDDQVAFTLGAVVEENEQTRRKWARLLKWIGAALVMTAAIVYWGAPISLELEIRFRLFWICLAAGSLGVALWLFGAQFEDSAR